VASQEDIPLLFLLIASKIQNRSQDDYGVFQPCPVSSGVGWTGRAEGSGLPIREIAAEHRDSGGGESIG
jgi:hypothetical protein